MSEYGFMIDRRHCFTYHIRSVTRPSSCLFMLYSYLAASCNMCAEESSGDVQRKYPDSYTLHLHSLGIGPLMSKQAAVLRSKGVYSLQQVTFSKAELAVKACKPQNGTFEYSTQPSSPLSSLRLRLRKHEPQPQKGHSQSGVQVSESPA